MRAGRLRPAGAAKGEGEEKKRRRDPRILEGIRKRRRWQIADMSRAVTERSSVRWGVMLQSVKGL